MDKNIEISRMLVSRQNLLALINGLSEPELNTPVEEDWSPLDLVAHIASWEAICLEPLRSYAAGGEFKDASISDHDAFNKQQYASWKGLPLETILENAVQVRAELLALARQVPEGRSIQPLSMPWGEKENLAQMISGLAWHENEHAKSILRLMAEESAAAAFAAGFSCSQAVLSAYAERLGLERELALKVSCSFGAGMARQGLTCGAVTGALMALGLRYGKSQANGSAAREENYLQVQDFIARFEAQHGSIECNRLLGIEMSDPASRQAASEQNLFVERCPLFVRSAAGLLADLL